MFPRFSIYDVLEDKLIFKLLYFLLKTDQSRKSATSFHPENERYLPFSLSYVTHLESK